MPSDERTITEREAGQSVARVAGRELDALVAERVMGWKWYMGRIIGVLGDSDPWGRYLAPEAMREYDREWRGEDAVVFDDATRDVPYYSTSIEDAWLVLETFQCTVVLQRAPSPDGRVIGYRVSVPDLSHRGKPGTPWRLAVNVDADTAPLAICRAALEASSHV